MKMVKQYIKQALYQLKEDKLISLVSVIGTALAICMIMVIVLVLQVRVVDSVPEVNRSRSLYVKSMSVRMKGDTSGNSSNGGMSVVTARECFKALTTPEVVTVMSINEKVRASVPGGNKMTADKLETDEAFWKVFQFQFIDGKPYSSAAFSSGLPQAVISETVARRIYGTTDVVGQTLQLNHADYTVTGVVKEVSKLATASYAQIWIPYTSTETTQLVWWGTVMGAMRVVILARSPDDFPIIRAEVDKLRQQYNSGLKDSEVFYRGQPDTQFVYLYRKWGQAQPDTVMLLLRFALIIAVLLLVPAINLSSMTLSRMRKRMGEMGIRKAFGATANELLRQVFLESLLLTLLAGVLGLGLSYVTTFLLSDFLFGNSENTARMGSFSLAGDMLLSPLLFLAAFGFCLLLNLLSAGIPAWRVSRMNITDALNQR